jgi:hypothetical protein
MTQPRTMTEQNESNLKQKNAVLLTLNVFSVVNKKKKTSLEKEVAKFILYISLIFVN